MASCSPHRLAGKRPESCREDAATTGGPRQDDRRTRSPQLCAGPASNSPNSPRSQLYLNSNSAKFHPPGNFLELASLGKGVVHRPSWGSFLTARLWACSAGSRDPDTSRLKLDRASGALPCTRPAGRRRASPAPPLAKDALTSRACPEGDVSALPRGRAGKLGAPVLKGPRRVQPEL